MCGAVSPGPTASLQRNQDDRLWDQPSKAAILLADKNLFVLILSRDSEKTP